MDTSNFPPLLKNVQPVLERKLAGNLSLSQHQFITAFEKKNYLECISHKILE